MDCLQTIRSAIEYMEGHMLDNITYEDAAQHVHMSNYYFHRLFSMVVGITANEYIRNRKLSMAGQELIMSDKKIIDIALKYGYESPESFTKAFTRFHGVTPNIAKHSGAQLKSFNRLTIKIHFEGGTAMEYKIVEREFGLYSNVWEAVERVSEKHGIEYIMSSYQGLTIICWMILILNFIQKRMKRDAFVKSGYRLKEKNK